MRFYSDGESAPFESDLIDWAMESKQNATAQDTSQSSLEDPSSVLSESRYI
jgi:hypothetical protein